LPQEPSVDGCSHAHVYSASAFRKTEFPAQVPGTEFAFVEPLDRMQPRVANLLDGDPATVPKPVMKKQNQYPTLSSQTTSTTTSVSQN
jgi:hypothetical protein